VAHPARSRRLRRWSGRTLAILLLLLVADCLLYPSLAPIGGRSFNQGENGLWLRYWWYFGRRGDSEVQALARRLNERQIGYAYFHVRHITREGRLAYRYPAEARRLVAAMRREAPSVKVIAWVFAGNARLKHTGVGDVDLASPAVRQAMVAEARWLVKECGFDGVQWDYEICDNADPHLLSLLRETRTALPSGKLLSAAVPMWLPAPLQRWGWSEAYVASVAEECDQLAVMCYDSAMYLPRAYVWLVRQQALHVTRAVARGNPRCRVLLGIPTYARGGASHHAWSENIRMALKGVREGLADPRAEVLVFAGVAPFAEYTTQEGEWEVYRRWWLESIRAFR
jgi:hypothetical protein